MRAVLFVAGMLLLAGCASRHVGPAEKLPLFDLSGARQALVVTAR